MPFESRTLPEGHDFKLSKSYPILLKLEIILYYYITIKSYSFETVTCVLHSLSCQKNVHVTYKGLYKYIYAYRLAKKN